MLEVKASSHAMYIGAPTPPLRGMGSVLYGRKGFFMAVKLTPASHTHITIKFESEEWSIRSSRSLQCLSVFACIAIFSESIA